jgi:hypothetical protein
LLTALKIALREAILDSGLEVLARWLHPALIAGREVRPIGHREGDERGDRRPPRRRLRPRWLRKHERHQDAHGPQRLTEIGRDRALRRDGRRNGRARCASSCRA